MEFSRNQAIIVPHKRVDWFAVVLEGQVHILQLFSNGVSSLMEILKPSYLLGADLLCTESRISPYYAIVNSPCKILTFSRNLLMEERLLPKSVHQKVWSRLITMLRQENMRKHYRLAILS